MVSRTISLAGLASALAIAACSGSEGTPEQTAGGFGGSGGGAGGTAPGAAGGPATAQTGGVKADAGRAGAIGTGGTPASGGSVGAVVGGAGTGGIPTAGGAGADVAGSAQGGNAEGGNAEGGNAGGAGAGVASGGSSGGAAATGGASNEPFVLAWQDDFNSIDSSAWQLQTFTWEGNQALIFDAERERIEWRAHASLSAAPSGSEKPYLGVEMRSTRTLTYGRVSARMRFAKGSGIVSGLVLFYTPFPNCDWNEIDIEHLGRASNSSQLNAMVYTGTPNPSCTTSVTPTQDPQIADLGFNAETDFHVYDVEWTPDG